MPSPLTMRRIIASGTQKSGPPTRGLQGIWFLGGLPGGAQTVPIYRGTAGTLQLGATTGAESTDPTITASGLSFVTDDYVLGQTLSNVTMAGDWTAYIVGLTNGTIGAVWSLTSPSVDDQFAMLYVTGGTLKLRTQNAGTILETSGVAISSVSPTVWAASSSGGQVTIRRFDTGVTYSAASASPTGACRVGVGARVGATPWCSDSFVGHAVALANVAHTAAERARMYAWLKSELAKPPYNLSVL